MLNPLLPGAADPLTARRLLSPRAIIYGLVTARLAGRRWYCVAALQFAAPPAKQAATACAYAPRRTDSCVLTDSFHAPT